MRSFQLYIPHIVILFIALVQGLPNNSFDRHARVVRLPIAYNVQIVKRGSTQSKPAYYPRKRMGVVESHPIATNDNDNSWTGTVSIGTPPQGFLLQIDTGSSTSWVVSSQCKCNKTVKSHDPSKSTTAKVGGIVSVTYGLGLKISGRAIRDTFLIGHIQVKNQSFVAADTVAGAFPGSGILGLGFGSKSPLDANNTIVESMVEQELIAKPVFGVRLVHGGGGEITFGDIDRTVIRGAIQYLPVTSLLSWEIQVEEVKLGDTIIAPPAHFTVDTGTTINIIPEKYAKNFFAEILGSGFDNATGLRTVPCDVDEKFKTSFTIGSEEYVMPAKDLAFERINNTNACIAGLQGGAIDMDQWILGDTFIKNFYVIFELKPERRVGIARRIDV